MFEAITLADRPRDAHDDCETLQAMLDDLDCYVAPCGKEGFDEIKAGGSTTNDPAPRALRSPTVRAVAGMRENDTTQGDGR